MRGGGELQRCERGSHRCDDAAPVTRTLAAHASAGATVSIVHGTHESPLIHPSARGTNHEEALHSFCPSPVGIIIANTALAAQPTKACTASNEGETVTTWNKAHTRSETYSAARAGS